MFIGWMVFVTHSWEYNWLVDEFAWEHFSIDLYPGVLVAAIALGIATVLLHYLYEVE